MATRPMAGFDSLMWGLEGLPRMRSWIVAALVLDQVPGDTALRGRLTELAAGVPRLRSVAGPSPRPLAARRWIVADEVDLDGIVRHATLPAGRGLAAGLAELMSRTADEQYRAGMPVWRVTVVDGLPDGRGALVFRLHHSVTDGVGAIVMAGLFFDADAAGTRLLDHAPADADGAEAARAVGEGRVEQAVASVRDDAATAWGLARRAGGSVPRLVGAAVRHPVSGVGGAVVGTAGYAASLARLMVPAATPLSPAMTEHSARTAAALLDYPVADLKKAARRYGSSLNDVYCAGVLAGLRRYHEALGVAGDAVPELRVYVPVNTRPAGASDAELGGNQFTPLRVVLSTTAASPEDLVTGVRRRLTDGRAEPALGAGAVVTEVLGRLPGALSGRLVSGMFYGLDVVVTNIPGPPVPLWVAGSRLEALYALAPRSAASVCTTLISYAGTAYVTVNADDAAVTDVDLLVASVDGGMRWVIDG